MSETGKPWPYNTSWLLRGRCSGAAHLEETYSRYLQLCKLNGVEPRDIHSFAEEATRTPYRLVDLIDAAIRKMNEGGK